MGGDLKAEGSAGDECSILLVEDSVINQKLVVLMLRRYGIVPEVADCGKAAVEAVSNKEFDLILMDLNMPGMDGIEAAGQISGILGDACPPIIALTADAVFKIDEKMAERGFKGLLVKPITPEILTGCIQHYTTFRINTP